MREVDLLALLQRIGHPLANELHQVLLGGRVGGHAPGVLLGQLETRRRRSQFRVLAQGRIGQELAGAHELGAALHRAQVIRRLDAPPGALRDELLLADQFTF